MDAAGYDRVLLETLGVGQSELDIAASADTTAVVLVPESGDGIQAMKAGLMEVADLFVVNKSDRPGADEAARDLAQMLTLGKGRTPWKPPVLRTSAASGDGIPELISAIARHRAWSEESGEHGRRREAAARSEVEAVLQEALLRRLADRVGPEKIDLAVARVARREIDPYSVVEDLLR
jgi:LAO/AO transport system kinase